MSATVVPRRKAATLMRPRSAGVTSIVSRAVKAEGSFAATARGVWRLDPALRVAGPGGEAASGRHPRSWRDPHDFSGERCDLARRGALLRQFEHEAARLRASAKTTRWPTVLESTGGSCSASVSSRLAGDDRARAAAIQHEARGELRAIDAGLAKQVQHLGRGPTIEGRRLHRDQHEVGGEQRRAHQSRDARPVRR